MSVASDRNKAIAIRAVSAVFLGTSEETDLLGSLCAEGCVFCFGGSLPSSGIASWPDYRVTHTAAVERRKRLKNLTLRIGHVTSELDRVVAECEATYETTAGVEAIYQQLIYIFDFEDERIVTFKEYFDTLSASNFQQSRETEGASLIRRSILGECTLEISKP